MKIKTGIQRIDNKFSVYFKIGKFVFNLSAVSEEDTAEWIREQLKFALEFYLQLEVDNDNTN